MSRRPDKRRAIVDAAERVFLRDGFTDASVDEIAAEADVAKQTVYNHFGDKKRLFQTVITSAQDDAEAEAEGHIGGDPQTRLTRLEDALGSSDDLERDLREFGRRAVRFALRDDIAALRRLVIAESARHPDLLKEWAARRPAFELALTRAIERQAERGVLDVADPGLAARQLNLLVLTNAVTRAFFGLRPLTDAEIGEIVDTGVDMWLRSYRRERR
jgi:TetR/AcrR family transcriptional repressor of mexJK operon